MHDDGSLVFAFYKDGATDPSSIRAFVISGLLLCMSCWLCMGDGLCVLVLSS